MIYVSRDERGVINGTFANLQPGYAEELLADDHPDLLARAAEAAAAKAAKEALAETARLQNKTDAEQRSAVKADAFVTSFIAMTPDQAETYINNNTANLAEVRALLVHMGKMLLLLARREFR